MRDYVKSVAGYEQRRRIRKELFRMRRVLSSDVIYFRMPKVASETIVGALASDQAFIPHSYNTWLVRNLLRFKHKAFRFTFVRHPVGRFLSAYQWACRKEIDESLFPLDIAQREFVKTVGTPNDFCMQLEEALTNRLVRLVHFYPQCDWVSRNGKLMVDFVGKLEEFDVDLLRLKTEFGVSLNISFGSNTKNRSVRGVADPMAVAMGLGLSEDAIRAIERVYNDDFLVFGYNKLCS